MVNFVTKTFEELTNNELYQLLKLRSEVFVVEQKCVYPDLDDKDYKCFHVLGYEAQELVAYARLVPKGLTFKDVSIGRLLTGQLVRQLGYGKLLMIYCMAEVQIKLNTNVIVISAQQYLETFYTRLGFITEGNMYLEDDIPHIKMRYINP